MKHNLELSLHQPVRITPLEREGKVKSMWITETGTKYEVRYFDNAEVKCVYFYEDELVGL